MVTPYLAFAGNCNEAMQFYQKAFQTKPDMQQLYEDYIPEGLENPPANLREWVLHAEMEVCGTPFWFADETSSLAPGNTIKLTASVASADVAQGIYTQLAEGAQIKLPPTQTFYSTFHAELTDKYGTTWNIVATEAPQQG